MARRGRRLVAEPPTLRMISTPGRVSRARGTSTCCWYGRRVGVGHRHHDQERRRSAAFDENHFSPLITHSSPSSSARRLEHPRIGAALRLGHREARDDLVVEQRLQILLLLRGGAVVREDLGVAGIGRLAAEDDRRRSARGRGSRSSAPASPGRSPGRRARGRDGRPRARAAAPSACSGADQLGADRVRRGRTGCASTKSSGSTSSRTNASIQSSSLLKLGVGLEIPSHGSSSVPFVGDESRLSSMIMEIDSVNHHPFELVMT